MEYPVLEGTHRDHQSPTQALLETPQNAPVCLRVWSRHFLSSVGPGAVPIPWFSAPPLLGEEPSPNWGTGTQRAFSRGWWVLSKVGEDKVHNTHLNKKERENERRGAALPSADAAQEGVADILVPWKLTQFSLLLQAILHSTFGVLFMI